MTGNPAGKEAALISPPIDFLLIGGLSLITLAAIFAMQKAGMHLPRHEVGWWAYYASFVVNYPHFAYSYQLFYANFLGRLRDKTVSLLTRGRMIVAGVIVPLLMLGYFYYAYTHYSVTLMGYGIAAMYFFVGWHYVKQGYGALITLSVYKKIYYGIWQKRILYLNAYAVWLYTWVKLNQVISQQFYYDLSYLTVGLPAWAVPFSLGVMVVTSLLAAGVILKVWLYDRKGVSVNGLTGYVCASYLWVMVPYVSAIFFILVPFFHSLQYLPFVWRYKYSEIRKTAGEDRAALIKKWVLGFGVFAVAGVLLGAAFMDYLPRQVDQLFSGKLFSSNFFMVSTLLFINIHHYFIDNAFWRRDNWKVQEYLFKS